MKIAVRGPLSNSGFGVVVQQFIKTLELCGHQPVFIQTLQHMAEHAKGFTQKELDYFNNLTDNSVDVKDLIFIDIGSLNYLGSIDKPLCKKYVMYTCYETINIHQLYVNMFNKKADLLLVSSNFVKSAFFTSGVTVPIEVLPHLIDYETYYPDKPMKIKNKNKFSFIFTADISYRKGLQFLIPAFLKAFKPEEDVDLILKTFVSNPNTEQATQSTAKDVMNIISKNGYIIPDNRKPIKILPNHLTRDQLRSFYNTGDVFVNPSVGEGFGLTVAESMACGTPVLTTRCSGPLDFTSDEDSLYVELDHEKPVIPYPDHLLRNDNLYKGCNIYNISIDDLAAAMRNAFDNKELILERKIFAQNNIRNVLSLDNIRTKLEYILQKYGE